MSLVRDIVLYYKVLSSCGDLTNAFICKLHFELIILKSYLLAYLLTFLITLTQMQFMGML